MLSPWRNLLLAKCSNPSQYEQPESYPHLRMEAGECQQTQLLHVMNLRMVQQLHAQHTAIYTARCLAILCLALLCTAQSNAL